MSLVHQGYKLLRQQKQHISGKMYIFTGNYFKHQLTHRPHSLTLEHTAQLLSCFSLLSQE